MLLGRRFGSLSGVAAAQILGLRARLTSPCVALPPLTPPVGRPLACRQALPRVRGSRLGILSTVIEHAAQGAWPPHWRPCHLWPPRRMPHGPVRRLWPRGPLWAARPDDPVARVRLRPSGRPACGSRQTRTTWTCLLIFSSSPAVSCLNSSCSISEADLSEIGRGFLYEKPSRLNTLLSAHTLQDILNLFLTTSRTMLICQDPTSNSYLCGLPFNHLLLYVKVEPAKTSRVHADQPVPTVSRPIPSHGPSAGCSGLPSCGGRSPTPA